MRPRASIDMRSMLLANILSRARRRSHARAMLSLCAIVLCTSNAALSCGGHSSSNANSAHASSAQTESERARQTSGSIASDRARAPSDAHASDSATMPTPALENGGATRPTTALANGGSAASATAVEKGGATWLAPALESGRETLRFERLQVDDAGIGCAAFTMLMPAGWKREGGIVWQMQYANLATVKMRVFDPKSALSLEFFPVIPYVWDAQGIGAFPPGSVYMGSFVAAPPRDPEAFVRAYIIPKYRPAARGMRVVESTRLPEVEQAILAADQEPGLEKKSFAARVRLEYAENDQVLEEDVYCAFTTSRARELLPTRVLWMPDRLFSFRAKKGELDALAPMFDAMIASVRIDFRWYDGYLQVLEMARKNQLQAINDAAALSRRIAKNSDEILEMNRKSWEKQQAATDRVMERVSDSIRGVERYRDPFESRPVELPSGYGDVWASPSGEYILSNDPNFRPDAGTGVDWRRVEKKP